jgi:2,3-bisphosphoglycerate-dependent phosphoglycerate mutase
MAIFLIRHGETALNAARVVQLPDTPLNERGLMQAARLAARLAAVGVARVLSSDHRRAEMTAERLTACTGAPLEVTELLRERDFGDIRGHAYAEFTEDIFADGYAPPGGETWEAFNARVDRAWAHVTAAAAATTGNLAVISHGLVCYSLAARRLTLPEATPPPLRWGNTCVTEIEPRAPWRVQLLNCTAHLDDGAADDSTAPSGL